MGASGDDNPQYISSNGIPYNRKTVFTLSRQQVPSIFENLGTAEHMEELIITGSIMATNQYNIVRDTWNWSTYVPNLKKLTIIPTKMYNSSNTSPVDYFTCAHYTFTGMPHVTELQLGGLKDDGLCYFGSGGYFRSDNGVRTVGTSAGLHLIAYRTSYHVRGGFENGTVAGTTTITQYNWETGEVMTS